MIPRRQNLTAETSVTHTIEVDAEVLDYLKAHAEPFVDTTPNSVLRRLFNLDVEAEQRFAATSMGAAPTPRRAGKKATKKQAAKATTGKRTRAVPGSLLPEERYMRPLLKALVDAGGQAPYREVQDAVERELRDDLMPADFEQLQSGSVRWQSRLQFVRLRAIERGHLDKNAPRGIWRITDEGRAALAGGTNL